MTVSKYIFLRKIIKERVNINLKQIHQNNIFLHKIGLPIIEGIDDEPVDAKAPSVIARESERAAQQSDGTASAQGRNPKGTGAKEDGNVS